MSNAAAPGCGGAWSIGTVTGSQCVHAGKRSGAASPSAPGRHGGTTCDTGGLPECGAAQAVSTSATSADRRRNRRLTDDSRYPAERASASFPQSASQSSRKARGATLGRARRTLISNFSAWSVRGDCGLLRALSLLLCTAHYKGDRANAFVKRVDHRSRAATERVRNDSRPTNIRATRRPSWPKRIRSSFTRFTQAFKASPHLRACDAPSSARLDAICVALGATHRKLFLAAPA